MKKEELAIFNLNFRNNKNRIVPITIEDLGKSKEYYEFIKQKIKGKFKYLGDIVGKILAYSNEKKIEVLMRTR
jgi:hypothetical protein